MLRTAPDCPARLKTTCCPRHGRRHRVRVAQIAFDDADAARLDGRRRAPRGARATASRPSRARRRAARRSRQVDADEAEAADDEHARDRDSCSRVAFRATHRQCRCASDSHALERLDRERRGRAAPARASRRRTARRPAAARAAARRAAPAATGANRRRRGAAPSVRGTDGDSGCTVVNANRPPGLSQRATLADDALVERRVLGEHADRVDEIEAIRRRSRAPARSPCDERRSSPAVMRSACSGCRASASIAADASSRRASRTPSSAQK